MKKWLRMWICMALLAALPAGLCACRKEEWKDLRLFCERFSRQAQDTHALTPDRFTAQTGAGGTRFQCDMNAALLLTLDALPNGRLHTVSLTGLADGDGVLFRKNASHVAAAYTEMSADRIARLLDAIQAGAEETMGYQLYESGGYRFAYIANGAGRSLRVMCLRYLPPGGEVPTLREKLE
jgi:hypothetical protein